MLDERRYNIDILRECVERDLARLNVDQRMAFDALYGAVTSGAGGVFFSRRIWRHRENLRNQFDIGEDSI
jgi:hypothetical protein